MIRAAALFLACVFCLFGCTISQEQQMLGALRSALERADKCEFDAEITAMYDRSISNFTLRCKFDDKSFAFSVLAPESIVGISGTVDSSGGKLIYDDVILPVQPLVDGILSPVCAPWVLYRCMTDGLVRMVSNEQSGNVYVFDDAIRGESIQVELLLSEDNLPISAEIFWQNRCVIRIALKNFDIM